MLIDLRSDTVTKPTDEMRAAMAVAAVGDDVYGDDPTVNRLEQLAAERSGKEAAMFVPSGTMGNQIALMTHTLRGDEVLCDSDAHVFYYENAGAALLSGCQIRTVGHCGGIMQPQVVEQAVRPKDIHMPRTGLIWVENSHNRGGGNCYSPQQISEIAAIAHNHNIPLHCDGARIFNAATALGVDVCQLTADCDSVMFCLSKGLCAPVGSMLAGSISFIERARKVRKLLGGGMRQAGIIAAAGIIALEKMTKRLHEDHQRAAEIARVLAECGIELQQPQTNIVLFDVRPRFAGALQCLQVLNDNDVLCSAFSEQHIRFVLHHGIDDEQVDCLRIVLKRVFGN